MRTFTPEEISKELARIQEGIPKALLSNVVGEVAISPTVRHIMELAIADPDFPPVKKAKLTALLESGELDRKRYRENPRIAKQIDNYVGRQINKSIREGRLPPRSAIKDMPHVMEIYKKVFGEQTK